MSGRSLLPSSGGNLPSSGIISIKAPELRLLTFRPFYHVFPAFQWFACDFGWSNDPSFCSWTSEDTGSRWQIQSSGTPTLNTGPNMDHTGTGRLTQHTHYTFPLFSTCIVLPNRWIRELHLHFSNGASGDQGGSAGQSDGHIPGFGPLRVFLVPHVWVTHRHAAH